MPKQQARREPQVPARGRKEVGDSTRRPTDAPASPQAKAKPAATAAPQVTLTMAHYFLFFLLVAVLASCLHLLAPYGHTIILAIILAIVFSPVHRRLLRLTGGRADAAALLSCLLLTLVVVLPLLFVFLALIRQGIESFTAIHAWITAGEYQKVLAAPLVIKGRALVAPYLPDLAAMFPQLGGEAKPIDQSLLDATSRLGKLLVSQGADLVGNFSALVGKFFLMTFTFYFVVRDEEQLFRQLLHLIPLHSSHEEKILAKVKAVAHSVLLGTFLTALAQGVAGGLAFWLTGLPALFWGTMMAFAALIPFVGTALIWLPAAGYLLILGRPGAAAFMVGWCLVVVGSLDNLLRPLFMQGAANMSTLVIFFALLGGLHTFGMIGLLYGPLLFGLAMVLLYIYEMEFEPFLTHQDES